nr:MAG TPA: hypothetical protein [Caudoviricetes sp.]
MSFFVTGKEKTCEVEAEAAEWEQKKLYFRIRWGQNHDGSANTDRSCPCEWKPKKG